MDLAKRHF